MAEAEIIVAIQESPEGGYEAHALGQSIYTQAETYEELKVMIQDAVRCHSGDGSGHIDIGSKVNFGVGKESAAMKRSSTRILTTQTGSMARPDDLLDMMRAKENGRPYDKEAFATRARRAVIENVRKQTGTGLDVPSDGEQSKSGFGSYQAERLGGFVPMNPQPPPAPNMSKERQEFPEYFQRYLSTAMQGAMLAPQLTMVCTSPVKYIGGPALRLDIENFKEGLKGQKYEEAFLPSANALGLLTRKNEYYKTQDEYNEACLNAMREEYKGILDAGFLLQIDDPGVASLWQNQMGDMAPAEQRKFIEKRIEMTNYMLRGLPTERIRYHCCFGTNQAPHIYTLHIKDYMPTMLLVNAGYYSVETATSRHWHDYHAFESIKLPEGKIFAPGMLSHGANWVEHPEFIAEMTTNYAKLVGRENVMITNDCGFASQAGAKEVDSKVAWAKLAALVEGAKLASQHLWRR